MKTIRWKAAKSSERTALSQYSEWVECLTDVSNEGRILIAPVVNDVVITSQARWIDKNNIIHEQIISQNKYLLFETGAAKWVMVKDGDILFSSNKRDATQFSILELAEAVNHRKLKWLADKTLQLFIITEGAV